MQWRKFLSPGRLVPSATILLWFIVQILGIFGIFSLSLGEQIILLLLGLLAIDALTERLTILEKILKRRGFRLTELLSDRSKLPSLKEQLRDAKTLDIAGMSLLAVSTSHYELLCHKALGGCQIRLLLLNPENEGLLNMTCTYVGLLTPEKHKQEILTSLATLFSNPDFANSKNVEIRIQDLPLAHGLFVINGGKQNGKIRVETYMRRKRPTMTPGLSIMKSEDPELFNTFMSEFEEMWRSSSQYKPKFKNVQQGHAR